jgi:hypothetical protein
MGERLAKEVDAIYKARMEQGPAWHEGFARGDFTAEEAIPLVFEAIGALHATLVHLAGQIDDPA